MPWLPHAVRTECLRIARRKDTSSELLSNSLCNQLCIQIGVLDLEDVQLNLLAGELSRF